MKLTSICWTFVCQAGRLEFEACVLAASMRKQFGRHAMMVAAVPEPVSVMGEISNPVAEFLESIGVPLVRFTNRLFSDGFPGKESSMLMMNKAFSFSVDMDAPVMVFLDSDQICYAPYKVASLAVPFTGRGVSFPGALAMNGLWERVYQICETKMPSHRQFIAGPQRHEFPLIVPPYFNSGIISIHRPWIYETMSNYVDCYQRISTHNLLGRYHYYEEQLAMTMAVIKSHVPYTMETNRLDESFFHYFKLDKLSATTEMCRYIVGLINTYPALREILTPDSQWQAIIAAGV